MKFPNLPAGAALTGSEIVPLTQGGVDVRTTSQAIANLFEGTKGADIASAATTNLATATGVFVHVTGTTTITALGTADAGTLRIVRFAGALTLTHNATSLILPTGANITTAANDVAIFVSEGSGNWRCVAYLRANGMPLGASAFALTLLDDANAAAARTTLGAAASDVVTARNTVTAITSTAGAVAAIDYALGDYFTLALSENVTSWAGFSNLPGAGKGCTIMVRITQDATPRTVAWPASFKWAGGSAGVVSTGAGDVDVLALTTFDNGTTWQATLAKDFS